MLEMLPVFTTRRVVFYSGAGGAGRRSWLTQIVLGWSVEAHTGAEDCNESRSYDGSRDYPGIAAGTGSGSPPGLGLPRRRWIIHAKADVPPKDAAAAEMA